ncbi:MAG: hypothetical protein WB390_02260 [Pseudolabrys sp.]
MMLGDILARLNDEGEAAEIILGVGDLRLLMAMQERAQSEGLDLAAYARAAVQRYAAEASDEEWITLMGLIGRAGDPGTACLKRAFENIKRG